VGGGIHSPTKQRLDDYDHRHVDEPEATAGDVPRRIVITPTTNNPGHHHKEERTPPPPPSSSSAAEEKREQGTSRVSSLQGGLQKLKQRPEHQRHEVGNANERQGETRAAHIMSSEEEEEEEKKNVTRLQETVHVQSEQLCFYASRLKERDMEIEHLVLELEQCNRRQASMELELEVHDFKYSIYDDYRRLMDKQRLDRRAANDHDDNDDDDGSSDDGALEQSERNSHQQILSKLDQLEQLFEKAKAEATSRYATLYEEHRSALTKIFLLERKPTIDNPNDRLKDIGDEGSEKSSGSVSSTVASAPVAELLSFNNVKGDHNADCSTAQAAPAATTVGLLTERVKVLEADNLRLSLHVQGLREELQRTRAIQNDLTIFKDENEVNALRREKDVLINKIAALETEIGFTSGQIDDKTRTRRYRMLERNLNGYIAEIMSLEDKMRAKESVIARLKERDLTRRLGLEKNSVVSEPPSESAHRWYEGASADGATSRSTTTSGNAKPIATSDGDMHGMASANLPRADMMRNRLNKKIEELKSKTKKMTFASASTGDRTSTDGTSSTTSRVARLRKRLDEISVTNEHGSTGTDDTIPDSHGQITI
jgi:hypothetical protein